VPEGSHAAVGRDELPLETLRRVPNLWHALLFVSFAGLMLVIFQLILFAVGKSPIASHNGAISVPYPKLQLAALAATYLTTLLAAWFFYPIVWRRSFMEGVRWNWVTARRHFRRLFGIGLIVGGLVQLVTLLIPSPKTLPVDEFFQTTSDAWLMTLFGTVVAPVFEEICFRGFLLPAFAIAYDWLTLPRTPEARADWKSTTTLTPGGFLFSAILTSVFFAMMHAQQIGHVWAAVAVLFSVSLVLTYIRVKTQSVACSVIVHGTYNLMVFLTVIIGTGGYRHLDRMTK
jgi:membrane protease YdiL (CAAX protease family)